ncbi:MAG TPA: C1 family peptidase [Acidobacteriota bacterium]|nr:C1 family peptidase [Acidobacteriota bacterium]
MRALAIFLTLLLTADFAAAGSDGQLTDDLVGRLQSEFRDSADRKAVVNAVTNNDVSALALNREKLVHHDTYFSLKLKGAGITNQKSSGRCWLFAGLNVFAPAVMKRLELSSFEFSQSYLAFWDKMEKANTFLEQMITYRDKPIDDRRLVILLRSPFGDGGYWQYVTALIRKHGVVPKSAMPETIQSSKTGTINQLASVKLRRCASELRQMHEAGKSVDELRKHKEAMLGEIYTLLAVHYGEPPAEFTYRAETKDTTLLATSAYTPASFRDQYIGAELPEYAVLMNDPTKPLDRMYQLQDSRNIYESEDLVHLNLPIEKLKQYAVAALLDSQAIYFSCDVGKERYSDSALLMTGIYEYDRVFGIDFPMTKAERLAYRESTPNHAMVLMGVDTSASGEPVKWLVQNSWGTERGDDGMWYMYDGWFDTYVYTLAVPKGLLTDEDMRKLELKPIPIPPWDPMWEAQR